MIKKNEILRRTKLGFLTLPIHRGNSPETRILIEFQEEGNGGLRRSFFKHVAHINEFGLWLRGVVFDDDLHGSATFKIGKDAAQLDGILFADQDFALWDAASAFWSIGKRMFDHNRLPTRIVKHKIPDDGVTLLNRVDEGDIFPSDFRSFASLGLV